MTQPAALDGSVLDTFQRAFCDDPSKTIRLLAPAGSGKTTSLLWRCLALHSAAPDAKERKSLVLTFTRAARDELRRRMSSTPEFLAISAQIEISTLNSWGFRWLKRRLTRPKLIVTSQDKYFCMMNVLRPIWDQQERIAEVLGDNRRHVRAARELMQGIDDFKAMGFRHDLHDRIDDFYRHWLWLKEHGLQLQMEGLLRRLKDLEILRTDGGDERVQEVFDRFFQFWRDATVHMKRSGVLSMEDQKYWCLIEMERDLADGDRRHALRRYQHILVDEFQDINALDLALVRVLARSSQSALVIAGDDDQAIFEWRGASPRFIVEPEAYLDGSCRTHILEINYRSPRNIVAISQRLIKHNLRRVPKGVRAYASGDAKVACIVNDTLEDTVRHVHAEVKRLLYADPTLRVALISRKRGQIIPYQILFASDHIPFCAAEDLNVLLSDAFGDLKTILLLKAQAAQPLPLGPDPVEAVLRICDKVKRFPLSRKDREALRRHLTGERPRTTEVALEALARYRGPLKGANATGEMSMAFREAICALFAAKTVAQSIRAMSVHFDGLQKDYAKSLDDVFFTDPPFLYLADFAERYEADFSGFYADIEAAIASLPSSPDTGEDDSGDSEFTRPLQLMTALRAKGKEFDHVFVLDCNQGVWPSKLAVSDEELEGERRLFYVAITRARGSLTLLVNRQMFDEPATPSQYLAEMGL